MCDIQKCPFGPGNNGPAILCPVVAGPVQIKVRGMKNGRANSVVQTYQATANLRVCSHCRENKFQMNVVWKALGHQWSEGVKQTYEKFMVKTSKTIRLGWVHPAGAAPVTGVLPHGPGDDPDVETEIEVTLPRIQGA